MSVDIIAIARLYFLSDDELEREDILSKVDHSIAGIILDIEYKFSSNGSIQEIADAYNLESSIEELKDLQIEYFIVLADILRKGGKNRAIELLLDGNNNLFKEVYSFFKDEKSFESELEWAVKYAKRDEFREAFNIVNNQHFKVVPSLIKDKVRFSYLKFAVAATVIAFIAGAGYLFQHKSASNKLDSFSKRNTVGVEKTYVKSDLYLEKDQMEIQFLKIKFHDGRNEIIETSISTDLNYLKSQQDIILNDSINSRNHIKADESKNEIEVLNSLRNTYIYDGYKLVLNLDIFEKFDDIFVVEITDTNSTETLLVLNKNFYKLFKGVIPEKLIIYSNKITINKVKNILEKK